MITWAAFRTQIRTSILNDVEGNNWPEAQVHDLMHWAMNTFSQHTALPAEFRIDATSLDALGQPYDLASTLLYPIPLNIMEPLDVSGRIYVESDGQRYYLDPITKTPNLGPDDTKSAWFWQKPEDTLRLSRPVGVGNSLTVQYFAYYEFPLVTDLVAKLQIPQWAWKPVATLVGAYALESVAVQSSTIDRWKDREDSGNPEHNALRKQQEYMIRSYEIAISKRPPQERTNFYRTIAKWR